MLILFPLNIQKSCIIKSFIIIIKRSCGENFYFEFVSIDAGIEVYMCETSSKDEEIALMVITIVTVQK